MLARIDSPVHDGRMARLRLYSLAATLISRLNTRLKELSDNRARVPEMWQALTQYMASSDDVVTPFPGQQIAGEFSPIPIFPRYSHINSQRTLRHRSLRESIGVGVEPVR